MFCTHKYRQINFWIPVFPVTNRFNLDNLTDYDVKIILFSGDVKIILFPGLPKKWTSFLFMTLKWYITKVELNFHYQPGYD